MTAANFAVRQIGPGFGDLGALDQRQVAPGLFRHDKAARGRRALQAVSDFPVLSRTKTEKATQRALEWISEPIAVCANLLTGGVAD